MATADPTKSDSENQVAATTGAAIGKVVGTAVASVASKNTLTHLTASGAMAAMFVWFFTQYLPAKDARDMSAREAMQTREIEERKATLDRLDKIIDKFDQATQRQNAYDEARYQRVLETLRIIQRQGAKPDKPGDGGGP